MKIGEMLLKEGLVSAADIDQAVAAQKESGKFLGRVLIEMGKISEANLLRCLSTQMHIRFVELKNLKVSPEIIQKMPIKYAHHYKVFPIQFDKKTLTLAVSDPLHMGPIEDMKMRLGIDIEPVLATSADIEEAIRVHYGVGAETIEKIIEKDEDRLKSISKNAGKSEEDVEKLASAASVVRLVNEIIKEAIQSRATDVHFERFENELIIRYRIDGMLQPAKLSDDIKFLYTAIVARLKIIAGLDIVERRIPQSGSAHIRIGENEYDLRVSVIPDHYGEGVVIRVLPTDMLMDLIELGMPEKNLKQLETFLKMTHGLIYVTGPTGSGKTTTLYACLNRLNRPNVKLISVEDPVEYKMKGIEQVQVNSKIGLTFASILRSVLRHDPDIIMVGEVRDAETAQITIQASLTGHLVLSTLHTNDAASAITRLLDMGVESYVVSSSVIAVIAQRLVRKLCPHCRQPTDWKPTITVFDSCAVAPGDTIYRAEGCEKCRFTGYQGRLAIYEFLPFTPGVKDLALKKSSAAEIRRLGVEQGMQTLFQAGWEKVRQGLTTPEEVLRTVQMSSDVNLLS